MDQPLDRPEAHGARLRVGQPPQRVLERRRRGLHRRPELVAVLLEGAGHVEHRHHVAVGVEDRVAVTEDPVVAQLEVRPADHRHRLPLRDRRADRVGAAHVLAPARARGQPDAERRIRQVPEALRRQHVALGIGEHRDARAQRQLALQRPEERALLAEHVCQPIAPRGEVRVGGHLGERSRVGRDAEVETSRPAAEDGRRALERAVPVAAEEAARGLPVRRLEDQHRPEHGTRVAPCQPHGGDRWGRAWSSRDLPRRPRRRAPGEICALASLCLQSRARSGLPGSDDPTRALPELPLPRLSRFRRRLWRRGSRPPQGPNLRRRDRCGQRRRQPSATT